MTSSVDGLVSGLNTTQLISQLMTAEAAPQQRLKDKVTAQQAAITGYQAVNTRFSALKTAADALIGATNWSAAKAISSSDAIVASASAGASVGNVTFNVLRVAKTHTVSATALELSGVVNGSVLTINMGGVGGVGGAAAVATPVTITDNTPQGIANAINAAAVGVRATVINTGSTTQLQVTATKTGQANTFSLTGLAGASAQADTAAIAVTGTDAQIQVGDVDALGVPAPGAFTVDSASNTFTNVISGVTLTATRVQNAVTVSVASDPSGLADKMQALADAVNAAVTEVGTQTAYDMATKKNGPLTADRAVQQLRVQLLSGISSGQPGHAAVPAAAGPPAVPAVPAIPTYGSFQQLGFTLDRYGKITFDRTKFLAQNAADPAAIQSAISDGLAKNLSAVAKGAMDPVTGTLTISATGTKSYIKSLNTQIDDWNVRLADRQTALQKQFSQLEVALGKMKNQASWLTGQIASLPTTV
jgi:flagellar hook-associated protein 2